MVQQPNPALTPPTPLTPPLAEEEIADRLALLNELEAQRAEQIRRRGGVPYRSTTEDLRAIREHEGGA